VNDPIALKKEKDANLPLPLVSKVDQAIILGNYQQIKQDVQEIIDVIMGTILNDSAKEHFLVRKG
jgi:hypothetical protein